MTAAARCTAGRAAALRHKHAEEDQRQERRQIAGRSVGGDAQPLRHHEGEQAGDRIEGEEDHAASVPSAVHETAQGEHRVGEREGGDRQDVGPDRQPVCEGVEQRRSRCRSRPTHHASASPKRPTGSRSHRQTPHIPATTKTRLVSALTGSDPEFRTGAFAIEINGSKRAEEFMPVAPDRANWIMRRSRHCASAITDSPVVSRRAGFTAT